MPEYIVFAMPPYGLHGGTGPFDIPEWDLDAAMDTARRYRARGWGACVIDYGTPAVPWRAGRPDGPDACVMARTRDEARIRACACGHGCTGVQRGC